jgi:hypothetical protein
MKPNRDRLSDNEGNLSHAESVPKHDKRAALPTPVELLLRSRAQMHSSRPRQTD